MHCVDNLTWIHVVNARGMQKGNASCQVKKRSPRWLPSFSAPASPSITACNSEKDPVTLCVHCLRKHPVKQCRVHLTGFILF